MSRGFYPAIVAKIGTFSTGYATPAPTFPPPADRLPGIARAGQKRYPTPRYTLVSSKTCSSPVKNTLGLTK
ncbi:MAG: hypothetical protein Kow0092_19340 [Deferrisomatales bacterium]